MEGVRYDLRYHLYRQGGEFRGERFREARAVRRPQQVHIEVLAGLVDDLIRHAVSPSALGRNF